MKQFKDWFNKTWNNETLIGDLLTSVIFMLMGIAFATILYKFVQGNSDRSPVQVTTNEEVRTDPIERPYSDRSQIQVISRGEGMLGGRIFIVSVDGVEYLCHTDGGIVRLDKK